MFLTGHALAGVFISQKVGHPAWAFLIGFLFHFVLDIIPHGDEYISEWINLRNKIKRTLMVILIDVVVLSLFTVFLFFKVDLPQLSILLAGVIGSILPDVFANVIGPPGSYLLSGHHSLKQLTQKTNPIKAFLIRHNIFHEIFHNPFRKRMSTRLGIAFQLLLSIFFFIQIILSA